MERINWIDWAKAIAITMVVFGHLPMEADNYLLRYITTFHMPLFFFISGYLTKTGRPAQTQISKYWISLILPYIIYNLAFYPYWLIRYYIENDYHLGLPFDWAIKPFLGALLLQHESQYSCCLNGVTWFIAALLLMKIILDSTNRWKYGNYLLFALSAICIVGFTTNEQLLFTRCLTPIGFMKCFPFYVLGHKMRNNCTINDTNPRNSIVLAITGFISSNIAFSMSRHSELSFSINMTLFYITSICAIVFVIASCKLLNRIHSQIIENISNGTLIIMGFHWIAIGTINYINSKLFNDGTLITYTTFQGILICLGIEIIMYYLISWSLKYAPLLAGKNNLTR